MDNELLLFDRINVIRDTINNYGIENFYLSFSGGKDSTVLHYLLDIALPDNNIPRVFANTGIEYSEVVNFVTDLANKDKRFVILKPISPIKSVLEKFGYPIKSKDFSKSYSHFQEYGHDNNIHNFMYIGDRLDFRNVPSKLLPMFDSPVDLKISDKCCDILKKDLFKLWSFNNCKFNAITGIRRDEGGRRSRTKGCISDFGGYIHFHPLLVCDDEFMDYFINKYNVKLCKLYYSPYNFKRTGCKGCPFNPFLEDTLINLEKFFPSEYKQCLLIWEPIYKLYIKYGYRISKNLYQN